MSLIRTKWMSPQPLKWQHYFAVVCKRDSTKAKNWIWERHQYLEDLLWFAWGS